jgi:hypothetical protein
MRNGPTFFSLSAPSSYFYRLIDQAAEFFDPVFMFQGNFPTSGYLVWAGAIYFPLTGAKRKRGPNPPTLNRTV